MTTEWRPDTCACVMQWDEIHGQSGNPIFTFFQSCGVHPNATAALNDNRIKNTQQNAIAKAIGKEGEHPGIGFKFENGKFVWDIDALPEEDREKARNALRSLNN